MNTHCVGESVQYISDATKPTDVRAAVLVAVHSDTCACLTFYCPVSQAWLFADSVNHKGAYGAANNYFQCLDGN